jgi:hypothetical protein
MIAIGINAAIRFAADTSLSTFYTQTHTHTSKEVDRAA